ncbi:GNAT family N-acetyltransferase [Mesorhizobium microcysteis]|uniref:GNAT family N-acetyltransferase n=1 Tax=Neoaquamicrobium microcysteis TaxID=2682781 RepID=A0A5D4GSE7_9HYPH|nr:GNAT family N-acetyltransferase [Mesorhizobium microcysteis]TYR30982.1 GNAT family N-acetyltransferase [Mesorhizobium microcysteis]
MNKGTTGAGELIARITHLEMLAPPAHRVQMPMGPRLAVLRATDMPAAFYRYLYRQVGKAHHWLLRRDLPDGELLPLIHSTSTEIQVLYVDGSPAGFFELDLSRLPGEAEIIYFGLTPDFQGRGLARFFLSEAVFAAWAHQPQRLVIHTNTLDSPRALQLYQRIGFSPYAFSEETVEPWL